MTRKYDPRRFRELVLFLVKEGQDDPTLGAVKLNKLLYYADRRAYLELGRSITGARYQHLDEGPAAMALLPARKEMIESGQVEPETVWYVSHPQDRLIAKGEPDQGLFSAAEIRIVQDVIRDLRNMNAADVTRMSHREWGWRLTAPLEEIPERTAWLSPEPLTEAQVETGRRIWDEFRASRPDL